MKHYWEWILRDKEGGGSGDGSGSGDNSGSGDAGSGGAGAGGDSSDGGQQAGGGGQEKKGPPEGQRKSIYEEVGVEPPGAEGSSTWPDDWRKQMAGDDEKALKRLERYSSPDQVSKALLSAQQRISSGEYERGKPEAEEELPAWREERGIPEKAEDYDLPVTMDGKYEDMTDSQKEIYDGWKGFFHEHDMPSGLAAAVAEHANDVIAVQMELQAENDAKSMDAAEDALRTEWGGDFRMNIKMNAKYLNDTFGESKDAVLDARMPDGTLLKNSVEFAKMIQKAARADGMSSNMVTGDVETVTSHESRKKELEEIQRTGSEPYTPALRKEYGEILEKLEGRGQIAV